ncbi:hypothetical protein BKA24_002060 [Microbacterium marinum]|uniref:Uncharacterized protein n=1 Tax=Microbacterium marinum TaxID=421115 RepID=A0A7W7BT03_9MICO|nr:hypothetical protein [Microbacterium marinum]MBB4667351.1 hypothetical protein [Microbacterium marinum]
METVLFDGVLRVHYGFAQIYAEQDDWPDPDVPFNGQTNGLLGGAHAGFLTMTTGLHTGDVPLRALLLDHEPALSDWEEVVEVSFRPNAEELWLATFDDGVEIQLPVATYRARWSARNMDAAHRLGIPEDEPTNDRYELTLWPEERPRPDSILRQTSEVAAYWHKERGSA